MRAAVGISSRNSPSCFAPSSAMKEFTPVALLSGRARPATRPRLTGSPATLNTIGIVAVAAFAAIAAGMRSRRSPRPACAPAPPPSPAVDRIDPRPNGIRSRRFVLRRSRFRSSLGGTRAQDRERVWRTAAQEPDHWHPWLLRPCRNRARGRRAAEQGDELASPHAEHGAPSYGCRR